jgi:CDP-4-dehydro-6-deoxyglucose reductase, E3
MRLTFAGSDYELRPGESVLEGMARNGIGITSACRVGACHGCLVRAVRGDPGIAGRQGLKRAWQESGYFLACLARPSSDLTVALAAEDTVTRSRVLSTRFLSARVLRVRLRPARPVSFRPGQHVTLGRAGGIARAYSIANLPGEAARDGIEFHVRVYPHGAMSAWLASAQPGSVVNIGSPAGDCCYLPGDRAGPLLLAGTGTGIAPLLAVARDALAQGHSGPLVLVHGSTAPAGLYLGQYPGCLGPGRPGPDGQAAVRWRTCLRSRGEDIADIVTEELAAWPDPATVRAYLCGGPSAVARMRRALFMAGLSLRDIQADAFVGASPQGGP